MSPRRSHDTRWNERSFGPREFGRHGRPTPAQPSQPATERTLRGNILRRSLWVRFRVRRSSWIICRKAASKERGMGQFTSCSAECLLYTCTWRLITRAYRNRSSRLGGCWTNNLTKKNFYVHIHMQPFIPLHFLSHFYHVLNVFLIFSRFWKRFWCLKNFSSTFLHLCTEAIERLLQGWRE